MTPLEELELQSRLWHIERACRETIEFMNGVTLEQYDSDRKLELIVEREFMIIG